MRPNKTGYLSSPKLPENIILSNYSNKPRVDKKSVIYHREIYFPYWENESPGGELWMIDDYHQEIHFPKKESKSPGGML